MSLHADDVIKIAQLAQLAIDESRIPDYVQDLSNCLGLLQQIGQVNTEGVAPMSHPLDMKQRLREDEVSEGDQREAFQRIAPAVEAGLYLVPRVIE
jgi:aspartyl-tRNA(Asn)/glutamyl-tRNA(Gln) amidotransferase subunit C